MSMLAPFAVLEQRAHAAYFKHLANATASVDGGQPIAVRFTESASTAMAGVFDATHCQLILQLSTAPDVVRGSVIVINGKTYTVDRINPAGVDRVQLDIYPSATI